MGFSGTKPGFLELPRNISTMRCDSIRTITLASNSVFHARMKHVEIDNHFIREKEYNNDIKVQHISTTVDQIADVFIIIFSKKIQNLRQHL